MKEQHIDAVMEAIRGDATIGIPKTRLHGVLIADLLAHLNDFTPLHLPVISTGDVVDRHLRWSLLLLLLHKLIRDDTQSIDGIVHGYDLGLVTRIDQHGANDTLASSDHEACGSIQIIHPAGHGFVGRGRHCRRAGWVGLQLAVALLLARRSSGCGR